ncbi:hypothetical protein D3C71_1376080 [compost metagenome]
MQLLARAVGLLGVEQVHGCHGFADGVQLRVRPAHDVCRHRSPVCTSSTQPLRPGFGLVQQLVEVARGMGQRIPQLGADARGLCRGVQGAEQHVQALL